MIIKHLKTLAIIGSIFAATAASSMAQTATPYTVAYDLKGSATNQSFGNSVCNAGDVNGDGFDDIIVGAPLADNGGTNAGTAQVLSGLDGAILYTFNGSSNFALLGETVSGAGDVNNDGHDDVVVGVRGVRGDATNGLGAGAARVYSGVDGTLLYNFLGDTAGDALGNSVSGAGDVNGDGNADIIVGAIGDDDHGNSAGTIRVFSGLDGSILFTRFGDAAFDQLGTNVSDAGDVNRDGFDDVVVGAPYANTNGSAAGLVRVFSGVDGSVIHSLNGSMANDQFGLSISGAGDTNGDGRADIIVGAYRDGLAGSNSGRARIVSGIDGSTLANLVGDSDLDFFGQSVSGAGDINGDGFADIVVGAYAADGVAGVNSGRAVTLLAPTLPFLNYYSQQSTLNTLELDWIPNGGDVNSTIGTLVTKGRAQHPTPTASTSSVSCKTT